MLKQKLGICKRLLASLILIWAGWSLVTLLSSQMSTQPGQMIFFEDVPGDDLDTSRLFESIGTICDQVRVSGESGDHCFHQVAKNVIVLNRHYDDFDIPEPRFISNRSRNLFNSPKAENTEFIGKRDPSTLQGKLYVIYNGVYSKSDSNCGYKGKYTELLVRRKVHREDWFHKAAPLIVPDGWSFQHFLDGVLPKLIQAKHILSDPDIKIVLIKNHRDKIINDFLEKLNISKNRIVFAPSGPIGADIMYYLCVAPPLHPDLWRDGRRALGAPEVLQVPKEKAYVVVVTRDGCHNCGRIIKNQDELISLLMSKYGVSVVRVFKGPSSLSETIEMFGKSRIVIGSHGGGMYNINFAPSGTSVVEIMPYRKDGSLRASANKIIWAQAAMLGQSYWQLSVEEIDSSGNMNVDLNEVNAILDTIDRETLVDIK